MRLLRTVATFHPGEAVTAWLMFACAFLAMAAYGVVKPVTRSLFIEQLGSDNMPWVQLAAGVAIGLAMQGYTRAIGWLPRRLGIPAAQGAMAAILIVFWGLLMAGVSWAPTALYVFGLMLGLLLISQFWTLANDIYDARQARRLFGFIGGGASLGGMAGAGITLLGVDWLGEENLLPVGAAILAVSILTTIVVIGGQAANTDLSAADVRGVGGAEAFSMLSRSRHLQIIALLTGCAAIGAVFIEQQLNMAAEASTESVRGITVFLAEVNLYLSLAGFVVQVTLLNRVLRSFGLAFALLLLPVSLGATAAVILITPLPWAPAVARALDTSLRYTIDRTTREVLFLPLPPDLRHRAKPLVDVTVDRFAKALGALILLVLIKDWGLHLPWPQISYASLVVTAAWVGLALYAQREYVRSFRRSLERHELEPAAVRFGVAEASTIQTLVSELDSPDAASVLHAIEMLETLGKAHLVTMSLLDHPSASVRARALTALHMADQSDGSWRDAAHRLLDDPDLDVRAAAVRARVSELLTRAPSEAREWLAQSEPQVVVAAAVEIAGSADPEDRNAAERALARLADAHGDTAEEVAGRRAVATGLSDIAAPEFRSLLVPLILDTDVDVARAAIESAQRVGDDTLFVPALVSRLGRRELKGSARNALASYGPEVVPVLGHFLRDSREAIWVRRHVPATLARIPCQATMDVLIRALEEQDGFLRYKLITAIEALRRGHPELRYDSTVIERRIVGETGRYYTCLTLRHNLVTAGGPDDSLLVRSLSDKLERTLDRIYRLLGLIHPWREIAAARYAIEHGAGRTRAGGIEYLDHILKGNVRRRVMPILDHAPLDEKVRHANSVLRSRPRDVPETVAQLIYDDDPVVAASAVHYVVDRGLLPDLEPDLAYMLGRKRPEALVNDAVLWATGPATAARDGYPVVELADRLRGMPLFASASVDELFRVARSAGRLRQDGGVISRRGAPAHGVLLLLEGTVRVSDEETALSIAAPAALNVADVIDGRPLRETTTAIGPVAGLTLDASTFLAMLEDTIPTTRGLFRMLLAPPMTIAWSSPVDYDEAREPDATGDAVDNAGRLRRTTLFRDATVEQLQDLLAVAREHRFRAGETIWGEGQEPAWCLVLSGQVVSSGPEGRRVVGPGGTLGEVECLTGSESRDHAVAQADGVALRIGRNELEEVLAEQGELLLGILRTVLAGRTYRSWPPESGTRSPSA